MKKFYEHLEILNKENALFLAMIGKDLNKIYTDCLQ